MARICQEIASVKLLAHVHHCWFQVLGQAGLVVGQLLAGCPPETRNSLVQAFWPVKVSMLRVFGMLAQHFAVCLRDAPIDILICRVHETSDPCCTIILTGTQHAQCSIESSEMAEGFEGRYTLQLSHKSRMAPGIQ